MTRGQRGKCRLIFALLLLCAYYQTGAFILGLIGWLGVGFEFPESLFGDALERRQKDVDTLDS